MKAKNVTEESHHAYIEVLHVSDVREAKNGAKYRKILVLITIDGNEFIETKYVFLR